MSQSGSLVFYTTLRTDHPERLIEDLVSAARSTRFLYATRTLSEDRSWEYYRRLLGARTVGAVEPVAREDVGNLGSIQDLSSYYVHGRSLTVWIGVCALGDRIHDAIRDGIPESLRSSFCPSEFAFTIGEHDLFEDAEHEGGFFIARPFVSAKFWGYGTPADGELMRERTLALVEVQRVKSELSAITGPLEAYVYWDV